MRRSNALPMPLGDNYLLYVTTEIESDHSALVNKMRNLNLT